jgi:glutathione S-transferase
MPTNAWMQISYPDVFSNRKFQILSFADALVDFINDAFHGMMTFFFEKDAVKKSTMKEAYLKEGVQPYLKGLEQTLLANHNGEGFLVGSNPTWADFVVVVFLDGLVGMDSNLLENYKLLKSHSQRVHQLKGIKEVRKNELNKIKI